VSRRDAIKMTPEEADAFLEFTLLFMYSAA